MKRKKVLHIVESFGSGIFSFLVDLVNSTNDEFDITIAYGIRAETPKKFKSYFNEKIKFVEVKNFTRSINPIKDLKAFFEVKKIIKEEKEYLKRELRGAGITVLDSEANFMLIKTKEDFKEKMLKKGILVRSCDNFEGLGKEYFRIAVKSHEENMLLTEAVRAL